MTLPRRTAEATRNPPLSEVVRSGRGRAVRVRPGTLSREQPHRERRCRRRCRPCFAAPCWPAPGVGPGECKPGLGALCRSGFRGSQASLMRDSLPAGPPPGSQGLPSARVASSSTSRPRPPPRPSSHCDTPVSFLQRGGPPSRSAAGWGPGCSPGSRAPKAASYALVLLLPGTFPTRPLPAAPWAPLWLVQRPLRPSLRLTLRTHLRGSETSLSALSRDFSSLPLFQVKCWAEEGSFLVTRGITCVESWAFGVCFIVKTE